MLHHTLLENESDILTHVFSLTIEEEGTTMLSTRDIRTLAILREGPFVFSFTDRVKIWQQWILADRMQQQGEANFLRGPSIQVMIRRNYIYEDALDKLSPDNGTDLSCCFISLPPSTFNVARVFRTEPALEDARSAHQRRWPGRGWHRWRWHLSRVPLGAAQDEF